jgi:hypothetical protein
MAPLVAPCSERCSVMENIAEREGNTCWSSLITKRSGWYGTSLAAVLSPVLVCEVAAELRNFKIYRFFRKGTEANRSKDAPVTGLETRRKPLG